MTSRRWSGRCALSTYQRQSNERKSWSGRASPHRPHKAALATEIVDTVVTDRSLGRVEQVAARFDVPVWRLQRLLTESVGVTPSGC